MYPRDKWIILLANRIGYGMPMIYVLWEGFLVPGGIDPCGSPVFDVLLSGYSDYSHIMY
jgi:hypothetical protein